ncbi:MAG: hypothetical protein E7495_04810 [Ruminococcus flavefaciens]|jgi:endoglucanase|nr:hypothetical protein [Ruminococcus flavefaciens]
MTVLIPRTTPFGIFVDQAGYLPSGTKKAVIPFECDSFTVMDLNRNVRYSGNTLSVGPDDASGDNVYIADFSELTENGRYFVYAGGKTSSVFCIGNDVYDDVFDKVSKAFYYLRCGSNMILMKKAMIFAITDVIFGDHTCREYANSHIHCLLGAMLSA